MSHEWSLYTNVHVINFFIKRTNLKGSLLFFHFGILEVVGWFITLIYLIKGIFSAERSKVNEAINLKIREEHSKQTQQAKMKLGTSYSTLIENKRDSNKFE